MTLGMLGQSQSCPGNRFVRDCLWAGKPALISVFIDIAMVTCKIAPAVNLQYDLAEWDQGSSHSASLERRVERGSTQSTVGGGREDAGQLPGSIGAAYIDLRQRNAVLLRSREGRGSLKRHEGPSLMLCPAQIPRTVAMPAARLYSHGHSQQLSTWRRNKRVAPHSRRTVRNKPFRLKGEDKTADRGAHDRVSRPTAKHGLPKL